MRSTAPYLLRTANTTEQLTANTRMVVGDSAAIQVDDLLLGEGLLIASNEEQPFFAQEDSVTDF